MKILVTGAKGFIGKNLVAELKNRKYTDIFEYAKETDSFLLEEYCKKADFVFHLAGVNRPKEQSEFMEGNFGFTSTLLNALKKYKNNCPVMISSSIQAELDNPYGKSKKAGEDLLFNYSKDTDAKVLVYRFPNVFGKWCRPNYNSAVATFCHNIAHDLPITINDPSVVMNLVYIDDVVNELIEERDKYGANDIRPGLTGWAQINGRDTVEIEDKARFDGYYTENMGLAFDVKCFVGTIVSVLKRDGVVEGGTGRKKKDEVASTKETISG